MERRPTRIRTTLALSVLALTLLAPWAIAQEPAPITEIRRQAEQGDAGAQYSLGIRYNGGVLGVPRDAPEAVRWFRLAAEQGHADAQFSLGGSYAEGLGVLRDLELAHMWLNIGSANGNEAARDARDTLERNMLRSEIARATDLARTCMASDYRNCQPSREINDRVEQGRGGVSAPVVISQVQPEYSEEARAARLEGVVKLEAIIHEDGSIQVLDVLQSLGFGLDEKAIEALEQWKFRPGMRNGEPVAVSMNIEVAFNLPFSLR